MKKRASFACAAIVALAACTKKDASTTARPARSPTPSTTPTDAPPRAGFTIHEWGLVATGVGDARALAATGVLRQVRPPVAGRTESDAHFGLGGLELQQGYGMGDGIGTLGGKPAIYVHLDPGVSEATLSLEVALGEGSRVDEHWPPAAVEGSRLRFPDVRVRAGACAQRTPPPMGDSPSCRTPDGFCEAAEIERYEADHDTCLSVGEATADLLFYRASGLDASAFPLGLAREGAGLSLTSRGTTAIEGPILYLERAAGGAVTIRRLTPAEATGPTSTLRGETISVEATRALLVAHSKSLGLTDAEAEAFVDAWAPAYFDHCHRLGPEAHGEAPVALREANRSLLYFAPRAVVDAMLPLRTTPAAQETNRVFLLRVVDATSVPHARAASRTPGYTMDEHVFNGPTIRAVVRLSGAATVRGGLSSDSVRRVIQRNISQLHHCYEQGLMRNPGLAGRLTVRYVVGETGTVSATSVGSTSLGDPGVENCIVSAFRRWQFPVPDPEGPTIVEVPLELRTEN